MVKVVPEGDASTDANAPENGQGERPSMMELSKNVRVVGRESWAKNVEPALKSQESVTNGVEQDISFNSNTNESITTKKTVSRRPGNHNADRKRSISFRDEKEGNSISDTHDLVTSHMSVYDNLPDKVKKKREWNEPVFCGVTRLQCTLLKFAFGLVAVLALAIFLLSSKED